MLSIKKAEAAVLFSELGMGQLPMGVTPVPQKEGEEPDLIRNALYDAGILGKAGTSTVPVRELDPYLLPMRTAKTILFVQYPPSFRVTVYCSEKGCSAVRDRKDGAVDLLTADSEEDLCLLMPDLNDPETEEESLSWVLCEKDSAVLHLVQFDRERQTARVTEARRSRTGPVRESSESYSLSAYAERFHEMIREVYRVSVC